ncbi:MAG: hypothetical protein ABI360_09640 [Allobranchiibius sp.]
MPRVPKFGCGAFSDTSAYIRQKVVGSAGDPPGVSAVSVGEGCWIRAAATILPGVTIGKGVVTAAGAVVTTDCPDDGL